MTVFGPFRYKICEFVGKIITNNTRCLNFYLLKLKKNPWWSVMFWNGRRGHRVMLCPNNMIPRWFCNLPCDACCVCGQRVAVTLHQMICLVLLFDTWVVLHVGSMRANPLIYQNLICRCPLYQLQLTVQSHIWCFKPLINQEYMRRNILFLFHTDVKVCLWFSGARY